MKYVFVYPGQGAQYVGMAQDLYQASEGVRQLFEVAGEKAKLDMKTLLFEGPEEALKATDNQQIAIILASLAAHQYLKERGIESSGAAGFSLGEYAALVDAGILRGEDAFHAVRERGLIMERVSRTLDSPAGPAGMSAVIGMDADRVDSILKEAGVKDAFVGLSNNPSQTVVSGTADGLDGAEEALKAAGARRVIRLKTSGPFHTPLMQPAKDEFSKVLGDLQFSDPGKPVYSNVTGKQVKSGDEARRLCLDQLVNPVQWTTEMRSLKADGYEALLEVGPGTVLAGHWKALSKSDDLGGVECLAAGTIEAIDQLGG